MRTRRSRRTGPAVALTLAAVFLASLGLALLILSDDARSASTGRSQPESRPLDDYRYDRAKGCRRREQPGTAALRRWLYENARGDAWGTLNCVRIPHNGNWSLHGEGRALDWRLDVSRPRERRAAQRLIARLLARDSRGRPDALARRMGLQEIIFNCRIWLAGAGSSRYEVCDRAGANRTLAHRDHIHFGLNWPGALKRTSFWR